MFKIGCLSSGDLGLKYLQTLKRVLNPLFIATDSKSIAIINFAKNEEIPVFIGNPREGRLKKFLGENYFDLLLSVNYLFIIEQDIIDLAEYAINLHGSLLPKYRGRTPHVWAIINNEKITGVTAHFISKECDAGDIVQQIEVPIEYSDTGAILLEKFSEIYSIITSDILVKIKTRRLITYSQEHEKATFFGKRTPEDGRIDWNWQKERIYNWIRAQAYPYPGAFAFFDNRKIIIDKISFVEYGFDWKMKNGQILSIDPLLIKTPNGVILIEKIREEIGSFENSKMLD